MSSDAIKDLDSDPPLTFYCGMDVHKRQLVIAIYGRDASRSEFLKSEIFSADPAGLESLWNFCLTYHPFGFAMEATGVYHHTVALFLEQKRCSSTDTFEILIINPGDATGIPGRQKTDKLDAISLARFYAAGLLKGGKPIIPVLEDLKAVFRMNARLEMERTALKNRIKKTLDRAGVRPRFLNLNTEWVAAVLFEFTQFTGTVQEFIETTLQTSSNLDKHRNKMIKALPEWEPYYSVKLSGTQKALIRQDLYDLDLKTTRQTLMKIEIEKALQDHPILRNTAFQLSTIPGISPKGAVWLLAELGDIKRFHSVREFLAYCGCVPRVASSANKIYWAHLSRHSNKFLRQIFYQAAQVVCLLSKSESGLKSYARQIYEKKRKIAPLAFCTIAAKIARISYAILRDKHSFSPDLAVNTRSNVINNAIGPFSVLEQKDLRKAKRALLQIQQLKGMKTVELGIEKLIIGLEDILAKK